MLNQELRRKGRKGEKEKREKKFSLLFFLFSSSYKFSQPNKEISK
jgi:hypothetical protein